MTNTPKAQDMLTASAASRRKAELYVALHSGVGGDIAFYSAACAGADAVLELGVGDARVLSRLPGSKRVGLDSDAAMLELAALCNSSAPMELVLGDMATVTVSGTFDRIIIPYNGLLCLSDPDKQKCLFRARQLLSLSGKLVFDLYFGDELHEDAAEVSEEPEADEEEFLVELEAGDVRYNVFEQNLWWPSERRLEACYRFEPAADTHQEEATRLVVYHHYLLERHLAPLLRDAGFNHHSKEVFNREQEQVGVIAW